MKSFLMLMFFATAVSLFISGCGRQLETVTIDLKGEQFIIEVARTEAERNQGLMNRKSLAPNRGMIFVYDRDTKMSFWMKNTTIPLSIAFISKDGTIREIHDMKPLSEDSVESARSVRYALEVNQGTFERLGIEPGYTVDLPDL
jgi:hypothetical protein